MIYIYYGTVNDYAKSLDISPRMLKKLQRETQKYLKR